MFPANLGRVEYLLYSVTEHFTKATTTFLLKATTFQGRKHRLRLDHRLKTNQVFMGFTSVYRNQGVATQNYRETFLTLQTYP